MNASNHAARRRWTLVGGACVFLLFSGCQSVAAPDLRPPTRPDVRQWVTPEVAAGLDAAGNFVLPGVPPDAGNISVSASQVESVARAVVRTFILGAAARASSASLEVVPLRSAIEAVHGSPIDWSRVDIAPWPLHAQTPVVPLPAGLPDYVKRALGSRTHILLYDGRSAIADIALSNSLDGVNLTGDSAAFASPPPSELARTDGLPAVLGDAIPLLPEVVVRDVGMRTGAKTDRVPRFLLPWDNLGPVFSRWAIHTDRAIRLVRYVDGAPILTRDVMVGLGPGTSAESLIQWYVAADVQPASAVWPYWRPSDFRRDSVVIRLSPAVPAAVVRVRRP